MACSPSSGRRRISTVTVNIYAWWEHSLARACAPKQPFPASSPLNRGRHVLGEAARHAPVCAAAASSRPEHPPRFHECAYEESQGPRSRNRGKRRAYYTGGSGKARSSS
jgi:hypothetical protein